MRGATLRQRPNRPLVWRYNILNGGSCGSTDKNAPHGYTNPDSDLHLLAGAAAIDAGDPASRPPADCPSVRRRLLRGRGREQPVQMVVSTGLVITFVATRSLV